MPTLKSRLVTRLVTSTLFLAILSGCTAYKRIDEAPKVAEEAFNIAVEQIEAHRQGREIITKVDEPWISTKEIKPASEKVEKIPATSDCRVRLIADAPLSLVDFTQIVAADCQMPIRVSRDAWAALAGGSIPGKAAQQPTAPPMVPSIGQSAPLMPPGTATSNSRNFAYSTSGERKIQPLRWLGKPLSELLDVVTSQLGLSWSYRNGAVVIHYLDTRTYRIALSAALDVEANVSSGASLTSSTSGGNGASASETTGETSQRTMMSIKSRFGADVQRAIEAMLTPGIGEHAFSPSIGTVTVTDTPDVLDRIGQYIDDTNARMSRQAMLYVTVASVELTDSDSLGINWNLVWRSLNGSFGAGFTNGLSPLENSANVGFGILDTATGRAGQFGGTQAILNALSKQGAVSIMRQRGVTTQHLQPTPIHLTNERQYVCGRSQTNTAQVGSTESTTLCSVVTGFAMDILPDIHGDRLTLQFSLNMSPPARIEMVPGNPERPEYTASVDRQTFLQRVGMRSGQTLVISDFQEASVASGKQGIGGTSTWAMTGSGTREETRRVLVIIISPRIMPTPEEI